MKAYNTFEIQADYDHLHSKLPSDRQRPIIGITAKEVFLWLYLLLMT